MAWQDRLREASFQSAGGTSQAFDFEDVSRELDLRGTAYDFPDADGTYVQRMRNSGRRYPLRMFFWGNDYDLQAAAFEALLLEPGIGRLTHPAYGVVDVVPFGALTRRDDLVSEANQAILEVTFWETTGLIYPTAQGDPSAAVSASIEAYNVSAADELLDSLGLGTAAERVSFRNEFMSLYGTATATLDDVVGTVGAISSQYNAISTSIETGIDSLVRTPATLARQLTLLLQSPGRVQTSIAQRLGAFGSLLSAVTALLPGSRSNDSRQANTFHARDLYASTYVTGSVVSVVNTRFETKTDAVAAADVILGQLDQLVAWRDEGFALLVEADPAVSVSTADTGAAYQAVLESVALAAGFLVEISFTLKQERRIVLGSARTVIDLAAELYGAVDSELDFLIETNALTGSEILELPRGREIVYYV